MNWPAIIVAATVLLGVHTMVRKGENMDSKVSRAILIFMTIMSAWSILWEIL